MFRSESGSFGGGSARAVSFPAAWSVAVGAGKAVGVGRSLEFVVANRRLVRAAFSFLRDALLLGVDSSLPRSQRRDLCVVNWSTKIAGQRRSQQDRKSTRLNSSHVRISYAVFCLKKKKPHERQKRSPYGLRLHPEEKTTVTR